MAIKKSDLYSSLWASCDELRGGMDASQYKDYVLFMLFIKYVSDKYGDFDGFEAPVVIPKGASFNDMIALKGNSDIGNLINTQVIQPLIDANSRLARSDFPDFNDSNKLGDGAQKVEKLGNLIAIFQNPALDFSKNRAENDDILGDAYEYLMRHFATESGKSKGQFYTPSEVSRIMAKAIGIAAANTTAKTTAYDPTCGSGSLLLKVAAEAGKHIALEGQEKDVTTAGLARMNMILHDFPTANVLSGNTLFDPKFKDGEQLRTYDYVVANPPFSDKTWSTGLTLGESGKGDKFQRFNWGVPPKKQGDYAYLLHIIRSLKSAGKGACILPHGVLFRGNAEAVIRQQLVRSGYLKAIIGLPANLFFGTGIPACIVVLDKENATARKGIFMIDASKGFRKDGPKNRLREQDIHRIVDTFTRQDESDPRYARMVSVAEISDPKNDYNLNLPRYIDSTEPEDLQDIDGHRGRDQDARGRRQVARDHCHRCAGRTRPRLANPHQPHSPTRRTLRHAAAAAHRRCRNTRRPCGRTSQEDGRGMAVKPGYKQTEVGVIPEEWDVMSLGEIGGVRMCKRVLKHQTREHGDVPFYKIGTFGGVADAFISQSLFDEFRRKYSFPQKGDVLISAAGTIGRTVIYDGCPAYFQDSNIVWIENDESKATNAYLWHRYQVTKWSVSHGGTVARLYNDNLRTKIFVPVPDVSEQRAIATALSDVDALLGGLDRLIAKKRDLKHAAMQQLLTGRTRLPGFHGEWEVKQLGDEVPIKKGQLITSSTLMPGDIPVIAGGKQPAYYNASANRFGRTVTISASGASAGYVALYDEPIFASDCSTISESESYCLDFVFYQLLCKQQTIYKAQTGGAQPHIHAKDLNPILFSFPSLPEQTAIASVLTEMDAELAVLAQRRDKTRALKQAMMQELLTGRIRLVSHGDAEAAA